MTENRKRLLNGGIVASVLLGMVASMAWYIWGPRADAAAAGGKAADFIVADSFGVLSKWATLGFGALTVALTALRIHGR